MSFEIDRLTTKFEALSLMAHSSQLAAKIRETIKIWLT